MILLLGAAGQLGRNLATALCPLGEIWPWTRNEVDLAKPGDLLKNLSLIKPKIIVNAAAYTKVDLAESETDLAMTINGEVPHILAQYAKKCGALLVHYSTDYVYDGQKDGFYLETDAPNPINVYGQSKLMGDLAIINSGVRHLIFRTSWVFSAEGACFPKTILKLAQEKDSAEIVANQWGSPTSAGFLAAATALAIYRLLGQEELSGLYHLTSAGSTNWCEYAKVIVDRAESLGYRLKLKAGAIGPRTGADPSRAAKRPLNSKMSCDKFRINFGLEPPEWEYCLARVLEEIANYKFA